MRTFGIVLFVMLTIESVYGQTNVAGTISKDSTWTLAKSPYIVTSDLSVTAGFTLTVDSGVVVRFKSATRLLLSGNLQARFAIFTSSKDTAGGSPLKGDWGTIQCGDYITSPTINFDTCQIRFGGASSYSNIYVRNGITNIYGTSISNSSTNGIYANVGTLNIFNSTVSNNTNTGITFDGGTSVNVTSCSVSSSDWPLSYNNGTASLVFNGVNSFTGNNHNGVYVNFSNTNTMILDTISIPYYFPYDFNVNTGQTLTISSGDVLKFAGGHLNVNGALNAVAGTGQNIYVTSYRNDNLPTPGSDTNGDGTATAPHASDWGGIVFNDPSIDSVCVMRHVKVSYAGGGNTGGITMYNASPTIDSCDMSNNYYGAMMQFVSNPIFKNNTVGTSTVVPIAISFAANPIFTNNTFSASDNGFDAIGLLGGTLPANSLLPIRSVTSIPNITYLMLESVTIPVGITLTINKGIVIKGKDYYDRFVVQGKLVASATPDSLIIITSSKDDNFGNPKDTNKDGTSTVPVKGDWSGIVFEGVSDSSSIINYCRLAYGALTSSYYNTRWISGGEVTTVNASPNIFNTRLDNVVYGVYAFQASNPKMMNDTIVNSDYTPIAMSVSADPTFSGIGFVNAKWRALGIIGELLGASGTIKKRDIAGITNITYVLLEDLTINSGTNVTVDPGIVLKFNTSTGIYVNGGFKAKGTTSGGQVIFTSLKDDNYGNSGAPLPGDTNGDGNGSAPAVGDWYTIRFQATSDDVFSLIDSCIVKFGGGNTYGAVTYTDAGSTLSNSTLSDSYNFGVKCENSSTPLVNNVAIANCRLDPIAMSLKANPTFTAITFTANGSKGIRILEGTLSSNATLAKRDVAGINNIAYIVDNLTISPNAVLTIAPGVVIKLSNYYNAISVQGALVANGTPSQKIVFTSFKDDSNGGDTNNDGNSSSPNRGDWNVIDFSASSADSLNIMRHCVFRYGGNGYALYNYQWGTIRVFNAAVVIDSSMIEQSNTSGIGVFGSAHPTIASDTLINISYSPIAMSMFSNPTFSNNAAFNVGYMALGIVPETFSVDATVPIRNFGGFNNITYLLYGTLTINTSTTITIPAGVVFKDGNWQVNGALAVNGTPSQNVVFTDSRDDSYGNPFDTNQNGSGNSPAIGYGSRISFADVSIDSLSSIRYSVFRWTDGGINLAQASPKITRTTFDRTNWGVYLTGVSNPTLDSCVFNNLTYAPMRTSLVSYPSSTLGDIISGTTFKAIGILDNETLVQDVTLAKRTFAGWNNIPYLFGNYTVASNSILTISPGVILKFFPGTGMSIHKGLIAEGGSSPDSTIVFTDIRDDFYHGDTNSDSTASQPNQYSGAPFYWYPGWSGLSFADESLDPLCRLRNSIIRYAGLSYSGAAITVNNASPKITYSSLNNNYSAIIANGASNPIVNYSDIYQNTAPLVFNNVNKSFNIDARWNWWGSNTGPTHTGNPGGVGQTVTDNVNYSGFLGSGALNPLVGDVSLNGSVQAFDASLVLRWLADSIANPFNDIQKRVADVSGVSGITAYDASLILQYVVGKISIFPVEYNSTNPPEHILPKTGTLASIGLTDGMVDHGKQTSVTLSATGLKNVYSADIELTFSQNQLKPISVKAIGIAAKASIAENMKDGVIKILLASTDPFQSDGAIVEVTFQAMDDVRGTVKSPITFSKLFLNENNAQSQASQSFITIKGKPIKFALDQNYPNPFNPTTTISYQVPENGQQVKVEIYNITGQRVRELVNAVQDAGDYKVTWDGLNDNGMRTGTGVYIYRMSSGTFTSVKKMLLVK
ncbi:MAG: right-handed parallel beta-helix repeat-containing protein [Bacteroidota bacterium]|nr:right-handed parallel beta-helix repeat-containing protein [Bacteroidota bacterium]